MRRVDDKYEKIRSIRLPDDVWRALLRLKKRRGQTLAAIIKDVLIYYDKLDRQN